MINRIQCIDDQLREIQQTVDYKSHLKQFYAITGGFLAVLLYNLVFHFYVNIIRSKSEGIPYWFLYSTPMPVYAIALHQAIVLLFCCHHRFQMINELLKIEKSRDCYSGPYNLLEPPVYSLICKESTGEKCVESSSRESLSKLHKIMAELFILCDNINDYYGPVFLASIGLLFAESSIQAFYCFTISSNSDAKMGRSIWNLFSCVHLLLINLTLIAVLSFATETISKEANNIQVSVMQLKSEQVRKFMKD